MAGLGRGVLMGSDIQDFYARQRAAQGNPAPALYDDGVTRDGVIRRKYRALGALGEVYNVLGYLLAVGALILVVVILSQSNQISGAEMMGGLLAVTLVGGFYVLVSLSLGQVIQLLIDVQNNTHLTAQLLDDLVDEVQDLREARGTGPPAPTS